MKKKVFFGFSLCSLTFALVLVMSLDSESSLKAKSQRAPCYLKWTADADKTPVCYWSGTTMLCIEGPVECADPE